MRRTLLCSRRSTLCRTRETVEPAEETRSPPLELQSMSRKGNYIDNGATEQVFGRIKDEFFRGRDWDAFGELKRDLEAYIHHWNNVRRQIKLKGLTPVEFRERALREAAYRL